jgi:hypothetical protein
MRSGAAIANRGSIRRKRRTPAAHSPRTRNEGGRQLHAWAAGVTIFLKRLLEHGLVQLRFRQQLLQPTVLVLHRLQPSGIRHLEAIVLGLPLVEGRAADPMLATDVARLLLRIPARAGSR